MLVHGFTQTAASWRPVADALSNSFDVRTVELPGHGERGADRAASFEEAAAELGELGGEAAYVGYSMGGRLVLRLALDRPDLVRAAVLIGASPGIDDPVQRSRRVDADAELAATLERVGTEAFLEAWLAQPLFDTLPVDAAGLAERAGNDAEALARALRVLGTGSQVPLWDRLAELAPPTLLIAGSCDEKFAVLAGSVSDATGSHVIPAVVDDTGHAVQLERPDLVAGLITDFLTAVAAGHDPATNPAATSTDHRI